MSLLSAAPSPAETLDDLRYDHPVLRADDLGALAEWLRAAPAAELVPLCGGELLAKLAAAAAAVDAESAAGAALSHVCAVLFLERLLPLALDQDLYALGYTPAARDLYVDGDVAEDVAAFDAGPIGDDVEGDEDDDDFAYEPFDVAAPSPAPAPAAAESLAVTAAPDRGPAVDDIAGHLSYTLLSNGDAWTAAGVAGLVEGLLGEIRAEGKDKDAGAALVPALVFLLRDRMLHQSKDIEALLPRCLQLVGLSAEPPAPSSELDAQIGVSVLAAVAGHSATRERVVELLPWLAGRIEGAEGSPELDALAELFVGAAQHGAGDRLLALGVVRDLVRIGTKERHIGTLHTLIKLAAASDKLRTYISKVPAVRKTAGGDGLSPALQVLLPLVVGQADVAQTRLEALVDADVVGAIAAVLEALVDAGPAISGPVATCPALERLQASAKTQPTEGDEAERWTRIVHLVKRVRTLGEKCD